MRRDRQMVVIAPQAVRMAAPIELAYHPAEQLKKLPRINVILMDRLMAITTRRYMTKRITEFEANVSDYAPLATQHVATILDLTPCFVYMLRL
jgi:hypothetical protein